MYEVGFSLQVFVWVYVIGQCGYINLLITLET